jgi:hypothetical protein
MIRSRKNIIILLILSAFIVSCSPLHAGSRKENDKKAGAAVTQASDGVTMPEPGKKVSIGNDKYLIYGFTKRPTMGIEIIKIQVYDSMGKKDTSLTIVADSWMPSMPGMHSGHYTSQLSNKGDYLTPVDITMPGDWEVKLTVMKDGKVLFRGSYKFDV